MKKKAPTRKRRGRRKKSELEGDETLMIEADTEDEYFEENDDLAADNDFDDEE